MRDTTTQLSSPPGEPLDAADAGRIAPTAHEGLKIQGAWRKGYRLAHWKASGSFPTPEALARARYEQSLREMHRAQLRYERTRARYEQSLREMHRAQLRYERTRAWARETRFYAYWGFLCTTAVQIANILLS